MLLKLLRLYVPKFLRHNDFKEYRFQGKKPSKIIKSPYPLKQQRFLKFLKLFILLTTVKTIKINFTTTILQLQHQQLQKMHHNKNL